MKTADDIYALPVEEVTTDLYSLDGCYYNHLPEVDLRLIPEGLNKRVEYRTVKFIDFDGRRYWCLATVWFDEKPIMIVQNAGREGDDHAERFITDPDGYKEMVGYLFSLQAEIPHGSSIITSDVPRKDLDYFYGCSLDNVEAYRAEYYS